jgi:CheY-like chemotaxis protein
MSGPRHTMARILVIDDEPTVCAAIEMVLVRAGHEVTTAHEGGAGIAAFAAGAFDLVLVDLFMPGIEGLETIRLLRERRPEVPIVAMSGFMAREERPSPDYLNMANKLGANATLAKPFRPQQLLRAVETCLSAR